MSEEILINVTPNESRVAIVENGMLQEVYMERCSQDGVLGNIYKGRVVRVLPGMQAAFIEIGLPRTAFLHVSDMLPKIVDNNQESQPEPAISGLLREGEEIVVQVIKNPIGSKGARLASILSIPSRYLVLLPDAQTIGLSTRIDDENERERLQNSVLELRAEDSSHGYIVRTKAEGIAQASLRTDMQYLNRLWQLVCERTGDAAPGEVIYEEPSLPVCSLRDLMHADVDRVHIDHEETLAEANTFAGQFMPEWQDRIGLYSGERPIFDLYGVDDEINRALEKQVPLKSGGYLIIDQTEAMTTVDVNTGAFVGSRTLEETIYKTNLEAAQAIARQLRLRNLGGIIIIDFIDMDSEEHKRQVLRALEQALERDHAKTSISEISELGLVEMTRKRTSESLGNRMCEPCNTCVGSGQIKTVETVTFEIFRKIMRSGRQFEATKLLVMASPAVVDWILETSQQPWQTWRNSLAGALISNGKSNIHRNSLTLYCSNPDRPSSYLTADAQEPNRPFMNRKPTNRRIRTFFVQFGTENHTNPFSLQLSSPCYK